MVKPDGAHTPPGQERSLFLLLREAGDTLEAAAPPFDTAAGAVRLRQAALARGLLLPGEDMLEKDLAVPGANLEEEAPPFDVEAGAARLGEAARAHGLLSGSASEGFEEVASRPGSHGTQGVVLGADETARTSRPARGGGSSATTAGHDDQDQGNRTNSLMTSGTIQEPAGPRIGPYILTAILGRGAMGVVYRAYDTVKARTVALKVLIPELAANRVFQEHFRRESKLAAQLSEPHIIPIHDYGQIDGRLFIDMRLVEGIDLGTLLLLDRNGPLPPNEAAWVIAQVASALDAAHAVGLVHRDVKPSNVLITGNIQSMPFAYLIDFGIARSAGRDAVSSTSTIGTLAYMAPERIEGASGDHRADVYSLACVLYECLTGHEPFTGDMAAVRWAQLNAPPPAPSAVRPGLPTAVDQVIARGMAKDPDSRYSTAGELAAAMLGAVDPGARQSQAPEAAPPTAATYVPGKGDRPAPHQTGADVPLWESDPAGQTQAALRAIVTNPQLGVAALASSQAMSAALNDLLPGRHRETHVLVGAAEVGLTAALKYHTERGMDVNTACRRAVRSFAKHTGFSPVACQWAVDELAAVLGLDSASIEGAR